jgi:Reverse transcriptase (RNA-dependent DNA polymerase).
MTPSSLTCPTVQPLLSWFYNYFTNRTQIVRIKTNHNGDNSACSQELSSSNQKTYLSDPFNVLSGCPQGGHLSGLAFDLYINDIHHYLFSEYWLYADDKKIGQIVNSSQDAIHLQSSLDSLFIWCQINRMELNINKCKVITNNLPQK